MFQKVKVLDSHTGGEPTRVVIDGCPELAGKTLAEKKESLVRDWDHWRRALCLEPRGSDALVGALHLESHDPKCETGVIFFNNVGALNMCVHGTVGYAVSMLYLGEFNEGVHHIDTPVGAVSAHIHNESEVSIDNVLSYRDQHKVEFEVDGLGKIVGDVAWGGNWFFLVRNCDELGIELKANQIPQLTDISWKIRKALEKNEITGSDGGEIDHIELFSTLNKKSDSDSKNFVLCPGGAYDRSPCGTGTSAKLACLYADGVLKEGDVWRQESIIGSVFEGSYREVKGGIIPRIKGSAYMTAENTLLIGENDPFATGIET